MNQLWQYWKSGVETPTLESIINVGDRIPVSSTTIGYAGEVTNDNYRSSDIRWFNKNYTEHKFAVDLLLYYAYEANKNAFGFDINYINDIQYTTYKASEGGKYDWHQDVFWANKTMHDRKLSLIIQLTDPSEYEGGDFQFDSDIPQPDPAEIKQRGTVIVFPSFLRHRVTPVTSGVRRSLVSWVEGPKFR